MSKTKTAKTIIKPFDQPHRDPSRYERKCHIPDVARRRRRVHAPARHSASHDHET